MKNLYPRYASNNVVRGVVPVNVPYSFPVLDLLSMKYKNFDVIDENVVLFAPNEWRGGRGGNPKIPFDKDRNLPAAEMASKINAYDPGTIEAIYITSDGGANLDLIYNMTSQLAGNVEIVSSERLVRLALSKSVVDSHL